MGRILVLNSTPLIYLAKTGKLWILKEIKGKKLISPEIKKEVVDRGIEKGFPDAKVVKGIIDEKVVEVRSPKKETVKEFKMKGLQEGDIETLALTKDLGATAIIDDKNERKVARMKNLEFKGTVALLLQAVEEELLEKEEAKGTVDKMIDLGWRCGPKAYGEIMEKFKDI